MEKYLIYFVFSAFIASVLGSFFFLVAPESSTSRFLFISTLVQIVLALLSFFIHKKRLNTVNK
jgi:uncharacterized membrane protein